MAKTNNVLRLDPLAEQTRIDRTRLHNKQVALDLADAGFAVLVADPHSKRAIVKAFQRLDTDIPQAEAEALRRQFYDEHGFNPLHVGATKTKSAIRAMFRTKPDALPAISCGPSGIVVIDNDVKERETIVRDGPRLFDAFCQPHGGLPHGVVAVMSQGKGRHLYFANPDKMGCSAGALKRDCETDVKGVGGYTIAPATIRAHDQRRYGTRNDLNALIRAFRKNELVSVPPFIREAIGTSPPSEASSVSESRIKTLTSELRSQEIPDGTGLLDPALDGFDMPKIVERYDALRAERDSPSGDRSGYRFNLIRALRTERPDVTPVEVLAIMIEIGDSCGEFVDDEAPGQGQYNYRNVMRDFMRADPGSNAKPSEGEAFGAVDCDDDDHDKSQPSSKWYENAASIPSNLNIDALPPRAYVYGTYLQTGHTTLLSAAGGVGKSAWGLSAAIDLACGVDHLGVGPIRKRKVLAYNGEDDLHEMLRRAGAYYKHHDFKPEMRRDVEQNLTLISGVDGPLRFAEYRDGRVVVVENAFRRLEQLMADRKIEIGFLDPLVGLHSIPENDNAAMHVLISGLKTFAKKLNVALLIAHHDKKNLGMKSVEDAGQDDARGAGTITTPMRVVLNMRRLNRKDAQRLRIPDSDLPHIIALSKGAKSNYSARDTSSKLFFANSVSAENGTDEFASDTTVALAVYKPRYAPRLTDEQRDVILAEIRQGEFRASAQALDPLVELVAKVIGGQQSDLEVRKLTADSLKDWVAKEWLQVVKKRSAVARRDVPIYQRGPVTPPKPQNPFSAVDDQDE